MGNSVTFADIAAAMKLLDSKLVEEVSAKANRDFIESGRTENYETVFAYAALSRHLLYYAQGLGEQSRGAAAALRPKWADIITQYKAFRRAAALPIPIDDITADDLQKFCNHSTRRNGSQHRNFYTGLALFLAYKRDRGELNQELLQLLIPRGEVQFLEQVTRGFAHRLNEAAEVLGHAPPLPSVPPPRRRRTHPEVAVGFAYQPDRLQEFSEFFETYKAPPPAEGNLHLIVYRGRESCPSELVKSFLAIKPGQKDPIRGQEEIYRFVHAYRPPAKDYSRPRLGLGWIVPMERGLYLLGGQKSDPEVADPGVKAVPRRPFRGLEAFVFEWPSLQKELMHGLCLSLNNTGTPLISRVCARPTPMSHSNELTLGSISVRRLADSIAEDQEKAAAHAVEAGVDPARLERFGMGASDSDRLRLAGAIAEYCNNEPQTPKDWDLGPSWKRGGESRISRHDVAAILDKHFVDAIAGDGEDFDFWKSLRFGPLTTHR